MIKRTIERKKIITVPGKITETAIIEQGNVLRVTRIDAITKRHKISIIRSEEGRKFTRNNIINDGEALEVFSVCK